MSVFLKKLFARFKLRNIILTIVALWVQVGVFDWLSTRIRHFELRSTTGGFEVTGKVTGNLGRSLFKGQGRGATTIFIIATLDRNQQFTIDSEKIIIGRASYWSGTEFQALFACQQIKDFIFPVQGVQ
jgi:hypothetical protein